MYKKTYAHMTSCMLSDNDNSLFHYAYRCSDDKKFFNKLTMNRDVKESYDHYGFPAQKVYQGEKHIMTYDMSQSIIFSSIELDDFESAYK